MTLMIHWYHSSIHNSCSTITFVSTLSRHLLIISLSASVMRWFLSGELETNVIHRTNQTTPNNPANTHSRYQRNKQRPQHKITGGELTEGNHFKHEHYCISCSRCRMPLHDWSLVRDAVITSCWYYANYIGYPSESMSSSKWHVWFASRCSGRCLSTWQMIAASCLTTLGALCGQLTFRLAWCREHSAVTATELLQPLDLACGTLFWPALQSRHHLRTVQTTAEGTRISGSMNTALCDFWYAVP